MDKGDLPGVSWQREHKEHVSATRLLDFWRQSTEVDAATRGDGDVLDTFVHVGDRKPAGT